MIEGIELIFAQIPYPQRIKKKKVFMMGQVKARLDWKVLH